jgi:hypothetical protein
VASKRYAEPEAVPRSSSASAPTIAVASLIATEKPKVSSSAPSSGSSLKSGSPWRHSGLLLIYPVVSRCVATSAHSLEESSFRYAIQ